jgi:hypothetical protein
MRASAQYVKRALGWRGGDGGVHTAMV